MSWTLAQLSAAYATLPAGTSDEAAASSLAAQTTTLEGQLFTVHQAKLVALSSENGSWARVVLRARGTATIPPASATDFAVIAAITITETAETQVVDPTVASDWGAWQAGLSALSAVGDLTAADVAAINALASPTIPVWLPAPTNFDIQAARGGV
jgi:hypothetical protein